MGKRRKATPPTIGDGVAAGQAAFAANLAALESDPDALEGLHEREGNPRTLAPRVPEVDDWVDGQLSATAAAGEKWKRNTLRPKKDPVAAALAAAGKYEDSMRRSLEQKRFQAGLQAVDEEAMIETIEQTPPSTFTDGVARRARKIKGKVAKLRPLIVANAEAIDKMPQDTEAQREARMLANLRNMRDVGKKMKE